MKSIRLNKKLRAEIASNIEQAYVIKNPPPEVPDPLANFRCKLLEWYTSEVTGISLKAKEAGLENHLLTSTYVDIYRNNTYWFEIRFIDQNDNSINLPKLNPQSNVLFNFEVSLLPLGVEKLYAALKLELKGVSLLKEHKRDYTRRLGNYMADVYNVLDGVNTTGQLLEVWEECEKFLPKGIVDPSKISLPTVDISQLNKLI